MKEPIKAIRVTYLPSNDDDAVAREIAGHAVEVQRGINSLLAKGEIPTAKKPSEVEGQIKSDSPQV